ncbi:MAG: FG-GAP-like repeat-containing protein [Vicinamibacterales bacterium]
MRAQVSARSGPRRFIGSVVMALGALCLWTLGDGTLAHEHKHTHQNLARASFRLLDSPFFKSGQFGHLTAQDIENEIAQGVIDEDECVGIDDTDGGHDWGTDTNWNSHFFEAKTQERLSFPLELGPAGCDHLRINTRTSAADRARMLYTMARNDYYAGRYRSAFRIVGRIMHLLEDMTSPAHVHDDPHGDPFSDCGGDIDKFERWGYCEAEASSPSHTRICEYFYDPNHTNHPDHPPIVFQSCNPVPAIECLADFNSDGQVQSYGVPPPGFQCRLWAALHILYDARPVRLPIGSNENPGFAYTRRLANVTYDFTSYTVHLVDAEAGDETQPDSELKLMLRGDGVNDCSAVIEANDVGLCEASLGSWRIVGPHQNIGHSQAARGRTEGGLDNFEEWWIMPTDYFTDGERTEGMAYIENKGGSGEDDFIPWRYGCTAAENALERSPCSERGLGPRSKAMYQQLYGAIANNEDPFDPVPHTGKTMLRIYGDVLYPAAVAYGAGLIQAFVDDVTGAPTAAAGGPYEGEACTPVNFDASGSSDENGTIASYAWDFTGDGTFDATTSAPTYAHAYPSPFNGQARVRVTDNEGFTQEKTANVVITADLTAPVITNVNSAPDRLAPADGTMVPVTIDVLVTGACNDATCQVTSVTSSEPAGGQEPDWVTVAPLKVLLRAERSGDTDRIYTIALSCTDAAGNQSTSEVTVTVARERRLPSTEMDFDLNGWGDVLWHHQTTGQIATWLMPAMGGRHFEGRPRETDRNWKIVGAGDIDQDGYPDLVWQHATDGRLRFWGTNDVRTTIERPLSPNVVRDTAWKIKAVADFNQDGKPDLVWQHENDGRIAVWFMNEASVQNVAFLGPGQVADLQWKIVGSGDFNRDGWPDLVWQHQRDGRLAVWQMHGTSVMAAGLVSPGRIFDLEWRIRGVVDVNGDDMPDLLWQHGVTGDVAAWLMNGTTLMSPLRIATITDTNWHIVGAR